MSVASYDAPTIAYTQSQHIAYEAFNGDSPLPEGPLHLILFTAFIQAPHKSAI